jgi:membrane-bound inhibitor of C-type lysozyme
MWMSHGADVRLERWDDHALGANMTGYKTTIAAGFSLAVVLAGSPMAQAQTFDSYRCADGTNFIVGFYHYDARAHLQIDGRAVTLAKRVTLSGSRYSGGGVTLLLKKAGIIIRHAKRPPTACELV